MKLKIISLLLLFLLVQEQLHAQDTLVLVKLSRLQYCNAKIAQVAILNERILVKDSALVLSNQRVSKQTEIAESFRQDNLLYKEQIQIKDNSAAIKDKESKDDKKKIKSLKKQNAILKGGGIGLLALITYSFIKNATE